MTITLDWDDNAPTELVDHYNIYQSLNSGPFEKIGESLVSSFDIVDPVPGGYAFKVSAVNIAGEGAQSAAVAGPSLPTAPTGLMISVA